MRKPELLGVEFKNLVDVYSGQLLWLEVMEGKEQIRGKEFTKEFGASASFIMKRVKHIEEYQVTDRTYLPSLQPRLFFGESWFGSDKVSC